MKQWINHIQKGTVFSGIEWFVQDDSVSIKLSQLKRKGNELELLTTETISDISALKTTLGNKRAFLVIHGSPVLTRFAKEGKEPQKALTHLFPNLNPEAFYYEINTFKSHIGVSISRKEMISEILQNLMNAGIRLTGFSLGIHMLPPILPFIDEDPLYFSNQQLSLYTEKATLQEAAAPALSYNINGSTVTPEYLLNFSAALADFFGGHSEHINFDSEIQQLTSEYREKRFFRLFGWSVLSLILTLLLINFFVFQHYYSANERLQQMVIINKDNRERLVELNETAERKAKLVEDLIEASSSQSSFYADHLLTLLPGSILLEAYNFQPVSQRIKPDKEIGYERDQIVIRGVSSNSVEFSTWIETMEKFGWVQKVEVLDYGEGDNSKTEFGILIFLKDE